MAQCLLPHGSAPAIALLPGAVMFAVVAQTFHLVTVYYLAGKIESSSELYGDLGGVAVMLLGLYMLCRVLVGSATWSRSRREPRRGRAGARFGLLCDDPER